MTTLELIEKYGIGHNCLADAYALGMAHGLDVLEDAVRLAEEKARVDAIEEYKCRLLELCDGGEECVECVGGKCNGCLDNSVDYSSIVDLAEELKEKKNE